MTQTRDHVVIRGLAILHSTAVRDWVCGECGAKLRTVYTQDGWRTECVRNGTNDEYHDPDNFIHKQTQAWRDHERLKEAATAQDVFRNLPAELQEAINDK